MIASCLSSSHLQEQSAPDVDPGQSVRASRLVPSFSGNLGASKSLRVCSSGCWTSVWSCQLRTWGTLNPEQEIGSAPQLHQCLQRPQQRATSWGGWSPQAGGHKPRVRAEPAGQWPSAYCCCWRVSRAEQSPLGAGCSARCIPESQGCSPVALHQDSLAGPSNWPPPQRGWDSSQVVDAIAYG